MKSGNGGKVCEEEYANMVRVLAKDGNLIAEEMDGKRAHLVHMVLGISGEAGELLDPVKKHVIYNRQIDHENVIEELGDIEFYMEGIRQALGISRDETLRANQKKLAKRYGEAYSDQSANTRFDKTGSDR